MGRAPRAPEARELFTGLEALKSPAGPRAAAPPGTREYARRGAGPREGDAGSIELLSDGGGRFRIRSGDGGEPQILRLRGAADGAAALEVLSSGDGRYVLQSGAGEGGEPELLVLSGHGLEGGLVLRSDGEGVFRLRTEAGDVGPWVYRLEGDSAAVIELEGGGRRLRIQSDGGEPQVLRLNADGDCSAVSYTHLTLPTNYPV